MTGFPVQMSHYLSCTLWSANLWCFPDGTEQVCESMWSACITILWVLFIHLGSFCSFSQLSDDLEQLLTRQQIGFHFNPLHFGGVWERGFQSKAALHSTLGLEPVPKEVFRTVLTDIEAILNSKPLAYVLVKNKWRWRHSQELSKRLWAAFIRQ